MDVLGAITNRSELKTACEFIDEEVSATVSQCLASPAPEASPAFVPTGLGPTDAVLGLKKSSYASIKSESKEQSIELDLTDINEDEINRYIMTEAEVETKRIQFERLNAEFLKEQAEKKMKKLQMEIEKGKDKKKRTGRKRRAPGSSYPDGETIIQEKKISSKINYDKLNCLANPFMKTPIIKNETKKEEKLPEPEEIEIIQENTSEKNQKDDDIKPVEEDEGDEGDYWDEDEEEENDEDLSAVQLLQRHQGEDEDFDNYEDDYY